MMYKLLFLLLIGYGNASVAQPENYPGCLDSLVIPSVFTPNGDTTVDWWSIDFPCPPENFSVAVYSRWGIEVYRSADYRFRWNIRDGGGNYLADGVYYYVVEFTYLGEKNVFNGSVQIFT